ncbi:TPA: hypothetical protein ACWLUJ_005797 [Pseudomonas aeruginosa]|nr:hypothetical protein [Pseudomonas aeruginosa]EIU2864212.1 hypothetical protein [Pseudomonas aeruginosa]HEK3716942.1 hypothetical protein [Pseudomonas aeruginosa]
MNEQTHTAPIPDMQPLGWVVHSPEGVEPFDTFTRHPETAEKFRAAGWKVTEVTASTTVNTLCAQQSEAHQRLLDHANETERYLGQAADVMREIVSSGNAYRECTDRTSPTGMRVAEVIAFVEKFQAEPQPTESA